MEKLSSQLIIYIYSTDHLDFYSIPYNIIETANSNNSEQMALKNFWYPSPRVLQLDAGILDGELYSLLKQQLADSFQLLSPKFFSYNLHPELWSLVLKLLLFRVTTFKSGSSYGFKLQNLKLSDRRTGDVIGKKLRYVLLSAIIGQYFFEKAKSYLYNLDESQLTDRKVWIRRLKKILYQFRAPLLRVSDDLVKIAGLINFVLFLVQGRYASLLHRLLGIVITPLNPDLLKFNGDNVSFEFQNRQLVWNVMTEFLVFVIPLLQVQKWRRLAHSMVTRDNNNSSNSVEIQQTRFTTLPKSQCAICIEMAEASGIKAASTLVTNPYVTNCGHIFCYICLATRRNAIENGNDLAELCPRCNKKILFFKEYDEEEDPEKNASIIVEYEDMEDVIDLEDLEEAKESNDAKSNSSIGQETEKNGLDLDDDVNVDYSDNEDLEEELDQESDFGDDDYDTEIEVE